jgi:catechol 2,3-dioxygenase-like lactoylglutathione lyase family enzyme
MRITQLNHVAVHVRDVDASVAFYRDVLGLTLMPRPAFDFPGAWFRIGVDQELHLIGREPSSDSIPRERHTALMVDDMPAWERHLRQRGIAIRGPKPRPDGALQIFLQDPDGHVIELCTAPGAKAGA